LEFPAAAGSLRRLTVVVALHLDRVLTVVDGTTENSTGRPPQRAQAKA
jgi:hypothetical protein